MDRLWFLLSRTVVAHIMHLLAASAGIVFIVGMAGPRYGTALAQASLVAERLGLAVGMGLWTVVMVLRRRRPGFTWDRPIANYASWRSLAVAERAGWSVFFAGLAVIFACLGALLGTIVVYLVWRST